MIDFKYHVVSLISVFLAVALGIVIGTTALNGGIVENLSSQVSTLKDGKRVLEGRVSGLEAQTSDNSEFDQAVSGTLVRNNLKGQTFLTFTVGDGVTADDRNAIITTIQAAGAKLTGSVSLTDTYTDPQQATSLFNYATDNQPPGVTLPPSTAPGAVVGALLANVLTTTASGGLPSSEVTSIMAGLESLGAVKVDSASVAPAANVVIITRGVQPDQTSARNAALLALARAFDTAGASVVIAGDTESAEATGLVGAARADSSFTALVSTLDNSDTGMGRISTVWALVAEGDGTSGSYGFGSDTQPYPPQPSASGD